MVYTEAAKCEMEIVNSIMSIRFGTRERAYFCAYNFVFLEVLARTYVRNTCSNYRITVEPLTCSRVIQINLSGRNGSRTVYREMPAGIDFQIHHHRPTIVFEWRSRAAISFLI